MKKLLSAMLTLTLSLNSFGANCSATNETSAVTSKPTVSEKVKQINNNLAQIKNKTLGETNKEIAKEESQSNKKDASESCENKASGSTVAAQKDENKPAKKSFREKQIEKLNKEIQNLEKTSNKKYFWKKFYIKTLEFLTFSVTLSVILYYVFKSSYSKGYSAGHDAGYNTGYNIGHYNGCIKGHREGYKEAELDFLFKSISNPFKSETDSDLKGKIKPVVMSILKTLHPDNLKRIKSFDDIKDFYFNLNNFYDDYLK